MTGTPEVVNPFAIGPYLQIAAFCEQVLEAKDGTMSLIRIIDTLTHTERGQNAPSEMPPVTWKMKLVLTLKAGRARGRHEVRITPVEPSGETKTPFVATVHFEAEDQGANLIIDMEFQFLLEGLYWFNIHFNEDLLTRVPFRIKYAQLSTGSTQ